MDVAAFEAPDKRSAWCTLPEDGASAAAASWSGSGKPVLRFTVETLPDAAAPPTSLPMPCRPMLAWVFVLAELMPDWACVAVALIAAVAMIVLLPPHAAAAMVAATRILRIVIGSPQVEICTQQIATGTPVNRRWPHRRTDPELRGRAHSSAKVGCSARVSGKR